MRARAFQQLGRVVLAASLLVACEGEEGQWGRVPDSQRSQRSDDPLLVKDLASALQEIPVETVMLENPPPARVNARTIALRFRSNAPDARFECHEGEGWGFSDCAEDGRFVFDELKDGKTYKLQIRARTSDGRFDPSPVEVSFVMDSAQGAPWVPTRAINDLAALSVGEIPSAMKAPSRDAISNGFVPDREIMVGLRYSVVVPWSMKTASFGTSHTMQGVQRFVRDLQGWNALFGPLPCGQPFERFLLGQAGVNFCDATPSQALLRQVYSPQVPLNHVEMVRTNAQNPGMIDERILVSAYEPDLPDSAEAALSIDVVCGGALSRGETPIPAFKRLFQVTPDQGVLRWCVIPGRDGRSWWRGEVRGTISEGWRLSALYAAVAEPGMTTPMEFARRVGFVLPNILVPYL
jgi:hypothetical protein